MDLCDELMPLSVTLISDINSLQKMASEWDDFINVYSGNPFLYTNFLFQVMTHNPEMPFSFLILRFNAKIVGVAPLQVTSKLGVRTAEFFIKPDFGPDLIFDPKYYDECFDLVSDFLFSTLKCSVLSFVLSKDSDTINKFRSKKDFLVSENYASGRLVLNMPDSLDELMKLGGKRVRRDFEKTEKALNTSGTWHVSKYDVQTFSAKILEQILTVDRASWKNAWRVSKKISSDSDLLIVLNAFLSSVNDSGRNYSWFLWILELEGVPVSYQIALISKNTAYFVKTGYNEGYKSFFPGIYICNFAIRDLIEKKEIRKVDFITDLEYLKRWKTTNYQRVQVRVSKNFSGKLVHSFLLNKRLKRAFTVFSNVAPFLRR